MTPVNDMLVDCRLLEEKLIETAANMHYISCLCRMLGIRCFTLERLKVRPAHSLICE